MGAVIAVANVIAHSRSLVFISPAPEEATCLPCNPGQNLALLPVSFRLEGGAVPYQVVEAAAGPGEAVAH